MKSDRVLIEDVLSCYSRSRKDAISKMESHLDNVRLNTAEKIYKYIHEYIESGQKFEHLSIRKMIEDVFHEV